MKDKLKKVIKLLFATENDIYLKLSFSLLITGLLFFMFALYFKDNSNEQIIPVFTGIAGITFGMWLSSIQEEKSIWNFFEGFFRIILFLFILIRSLYFCLYSVADTQGVELIIYSILSYIGILSCSFYLISKFVDIFNFVKNLFTQIKRKLFNSIQNGESEQKTTKLKAFIENVTAFLISVAGLGVAIKAIIEPIINLIKPLFIS